MVDNASTDNGFVGVQLRNLIVGSKYKISITVDNNAALDSNQVLIIEFYLKK